MIKVPVVLEGRQMFQCLWTSATSMSSHDMVSKEAVIVAVLVLCIVVRATGAVADVIGLSALCLTRCRFTRINMRQARSCSYHVYIALLSWSDTFSLRQYPSMHYL